MDKLGNPSENISGSGRHTEEKNWVKAIQSGDKKVFRLMFDTYYHPLLRFAFRYVKAEAIAEELVQNIFLWIWENRHEWNVNGKLKTYLFRAIKYKAMDYGRQERTRRQYIDQFSEEEEREFKTDLDVQEQKESKFIQVVQETIEELPERPRMIYKLSRLEGLTYSEIAEVLEISPKTVEAHMSRALSFLRERLAKYAPLMPIIGFINNILR